MSSLHRLCPAPEALVDYVFEGPTDFVTSHLQVCPECSREVIDVFKRRELLNRIEQEEQSDAIPASLWNAVQDTHRVPGPPITLSLRLQPRPTFLKEQEDGSELLPRAAAGGLRGSSDETVAELTTNTGLRIVFMVVDGVLAVRAMRDGAPESGVRLSFDAEGEESEPKIDLSIATDETGKARVELASLGALKGVGIRVEGLE